MLRRPAQLHAQALRGVSLLAHGSATSVSSRSLHTAPPLLLQPVAQRNTSFPSPESPPLVAPHCRLPASRRRLLTTIERIKTMPFPKRPRSHPGTFGVAQAYAHDHTIPALPLLFVRYFSSGVFVRSLGVRGIGRIRTQSRFERTLRCRRGEGGKYPRWRAVPH